MTDPRDAIGEATRRAVLGDAHVDRSIAASTEFARPLLEYLTRAGWGDVWSRDGLDRRARSCVTLGVLVALHAHEELAVHVRGAVRNGLTPSEIGEVVLHTAVYAGHTGRGWPPCGWPSAPSSRSEACPSRRSVIDRRRSVSPPVAGQHDNDLRRTGSARVLRSAAIGRQ